MRYIIRLSYLGSDFCGWQIQTRFRSVQETIQNALSTLLKEEIQIVGAGRTDSGVNAINYIAHFDTSTDFQPELLTCKLNAMLPKSLIIHEISQTTPEFHARFDAKSREYHYFIHRKKDPFMDNFSYLCRYPLDIDAINESCTYLLGTHDFSCFEKTGGNNKTSICTITEAKISTWIPPHVSALGYDAQEGDYLVFTIKADRFLRNMVRAIVGTMIDIGRGRHKPEWIEELIATGKRSDAGSSVPGHPLFFTDVAY